MAFHKSGRRLNEWFSMEILDLKGIPMARCSATRNCLKWLGCRKWGFKRWGPWQPFHPPNLGAWNLPPKFGACGLSKKTLVLQYFRTPTPEIRGVKTQPPKFGGYGLSGDLSKSQDIWWKSAFSCVFWISQVLVRPSGKWQKRQKTGEKGRAARHRGCYTPFCGNPKWGRSNSVDTDAGHSTSAQGSSPR